MMSMDNCYRALLMWMGWWWTEVDIVFVEDGVDCYDYVRTMCVCDG